MGPAEEMHQVAILQCSSRQTTHCLIIEESLDRVVHFFAREPTLRREVSMDVSLDSAMRTVAQSAGQERFDRKAAEVYA